MRRIALFFGAGTLYNRDNREYLVKAFPVSIRFTDGPDRISPATFPCRFSVPPASNWPAPAEPIDGVEWNAFACLAFGAGRIISPIFMRPIATIPRPTPGEDLVLLDTRDAEGGGDWSGSFVGTSFIFSHDANLGTLEGDPRFFFDDSLTPQAQGTGTEEWGGGGDYWGGRT